MAIYGIVAFLPKSWIGNQIRFFPIFRLFPTSRLPDSTALIETQGRSIALLTPLLHFSNSSGILWFDNNSRSSRNTTVEVGFADVEATMCSCLPRSASTNQLQPVRVDYQCQGDTNRWECMEMNTSCYKSQFFHQELPASLSWWGLQLKGASIMH